MKQRWIRTQPVQARRATTSMEIVVSCLLLSASLVTLGVFRTRVAINGANMRMAALARSELRSAREIVGSWSPEAITANRIESLEISPMAKATLPDARWTAKVESIQQPVHGFRVFLDLQWFRLEQVQSTGGITFWIEAEEPAP